MFPPLAHHRYYHRLQKTALLEKAEFSLSDACTDPISIQALIDAGEQNEYFQSALNQTSGYTPIQGSASVRQAISHFHAQQPEEYYITFNGAQEALFCTLGALLETGDEVLTFSPAYPTFLETPKIFGATVKIIPLLPFVNQTDARSLVDNISTNISPKTKVILLNQPHNPTGWVFSPAEIAQIHTLIENTQIYLISDEVSLHSYFQTPNMSLYKPLKNLIALGVCAKSLGLSALRIGWAISSNPDLHDKMRHVKTHLGVCTSRADEILLEIALSQAETLMKKNNQILTENFQCFHEFANEFPQDLTWSRPKAGLLSIVELSIKYPIDRFAKHLLENQNLLLLPSHTLGLEGNYFRLGMGRSDFQSALKRLGNAFKS